MAYKIGHTWPGERGDRTIVNIIPHPHTGQPAYVVQSPGQPFPNLISEDRIDDEIALDAKLREQAIRRQQASIESEKILREREALQLEHDSWFGFTDHLPPLKKGKVLSILGKHMTLNDGEIEERGNVVALLVTQGRKVTTRPDGIRYLISDDGRYLSEKDLTKVGMDFAEYLLRERGT